MMSLLTSVLTALSNRVSARSSSGVTIHCGCCKIRASAPVTAVHSRGLRLPASPFLQGPPLHVKAMTPRDQPPAHLLPQ